MIDIYRLFLEQGKRLTYGRRPERLKRPLEQAELSRDKLTTSVWQDV
jgi:hypothetical protein